MNGAVTDQLARYLEYDSGDIASCEKILSIQKRVGVKPAFLEQSIAKHG
jgi:hypothetical protein